MLKSARNEVTNQLSDLDLDDKIQKQVKKYVKETLQKHEDQIINKKQEQPKIVHIHQPSPEASGKGSGISKA